MTEYKDDFDWRERAVTHFKGDQTLWGKEYKDGTVIKQSSMCKFKNGKILSFITPSMSALFLNISYNNYIKSEKFLAFKYYRKFGKTNNTLVPISNENFYYILENRINSIVMSINALEIFLNENIPEDYIYHQVNKRKNNKQLVKKQIEKLSIGEKISKVYPDILELNSFKLDIWKSFCELKELRHRLVHLKTNDLHNSNQNDDTIWNRIVNVNMENPAITVKSIMLYLSDGKQRFLKKIPF